jgi:antitoxin component YwqK of YwqJK toxin-antitoxin module
MRYSLATACFLWLMAVCFVQCKPAVSDVVVEVVDTAYIKQLPSLADTFFTVTVGENEKILGAATAIQYQIGGNQKELLLHFDATGSVLAMREKRYGKTIDSVFFYPNGQRMFLLSLDAEGIADGTARFFYPDGRVKEDGRYALGRKNGIWRHFKEDGKLQFSEEYDRYGNKTR